MVCHPDLEELLQAWPAELPDEFFEVTVDDVRRRLAQLKSERWVCLLAAPSASPCSRILSSTSEGRGPRPSGPMWGAAHGAWHGDLPLGLATETPDLHAPTHSPCRKRLEEAPLVTRAFREAQMREKLERYPKVWRRAGGDLQRARASPLGPWLGSPALPTGPARPWFMTSRSCLAGQGGGQGWPGRGGSWPFCLPQPWCLLAWVGDLAIVGLGVQRDRFWPFLLTRCLLVAQVVLRVLFPDRYILQGFFRPNETGKWPCLGVRGGTGVPLSPSKRLLASFFQAMGL